MSSGILWDVAPDAWTETAAGRFASTQGFDSYVDLWRWSIEDLEGFWEAVASWYRLRWHQAPSSTLERAADGGVHGARWFTGATLNFAEHALRRAQAHPDEVVVVTRCEGGPQGQLTGGELVRGVALMADRLRAAGIGVNDVVAGYVGTTAETLVAFLATASLGAVWVCCPPEMQGRAVVDRIGPLAPRGFISTDGYTFGSKVIDRRREVEEILAAVPSIVVHIAAAEIDVAGRGAEATGRSDERAVALPFTPVPFDHPLYVLFSSGTTGPPKGIVHGHGGIVLEHSKMLGLHQDLSPADRFFWYTTTGWMLWNYVVSGLLVGSSVVLYDGSPTYDGIGSLWTVAAETEATVFGSSAGYLTRCASAGQRPARGRLRWVGSTGSPLPASGFRWVKEALDVPVSSISGGTDVCTALVGTSPLVPVYEGRISCPILGVAVGAVDDDGRPVPAGRTGEMVVTEPLPSMPVGFWGDPEGDRYRAAYFDRFGTGVWVHGDWVTFLDDSSCTVSGRSDATLNRGGVRLGTSEFYAVVEQMAEVDDSLVIHLEAGGDREHDQLLLFVTLADGVEWSPELEDRIGGRLRQALSPRHVPDRIVAVPAVPHTATGKKLEVPVKRILLGGALRDVVDLAAVDSPDAMAWFDSAGRALIAEESRR